MKDSIKPLPLKNYLFIWLGLTLGIALLGTLASLQSSPVLNSFIPLPTQDTVMAKLGEDKTHTVIDGRSISTLVESPDIGLVEVGVKVKGDLSEGEIFLIDELGRVHTADSIINDNDTNLFTINFENPQGLNFNLLWSNNGTLLALISSK
jgi:hypothetical protein